MTRVVMVVPTFPRRSETFIVDKFRGLLERGWDVHVACTSIGPADWDVYPEFATPAVRRRVHAAVPVRPRWRAAGAAPGVLGRCIASAPRASGGYLKQGALVPLYLDAQLVRLKPDIVHFEFGALARGRMHLRGWTGSRIVVSFRGYDISLVGLDDVGYYNAIWQEADALHFLGEDLWRLARKRGCPPGKRHALIPPAVDAAFFDPDLVANVPERDANVLEIISVGRLAWVKGYEYALHAVALLRSRGVVCRYTIVGDGPYLDAVAFTCHQLGLGDIVNFAGALTREQIRTRMRNADVFLHAAVAEGFCNAVLEAQSMRLPVVTSDAGGLAENVLDGVTGFVVPRRDPEALAGALGILASDTQRRARMGATGRERVVKEFCKDRQLEAFETLYRAVLEPTAWQPLI